MEEKLDLTRRTLIKATATLAAAVPTIAMATSAALGAEQTPSPTTETATQPTTLVDVPPGPNTKLSIERRGQVVLLGLNRPAVQNRIDPETFQALARAMYDYDHDPSLRAAILFGHGDNFSRGIDVDAYKATVNNNGNILAGLNHVISPLNYGPTRRSKPLIAAVHGDTWNMAHELFLSADIRVAAENTRFGQDENSHGRFPGGGSTVRFVREAGWGNAMRFMLTGDHWGAEDAYRMGILQEIAETPQATLDRAIAIANKIAACGPIGVQTTLASAHLAVDSSDAIAFSQLGTQYSALYRTKDFIEGMAAQAEGRPPVFHGH
ncbi:enoyl-CoA hydratase [Dickeya dadantii]|uniref:Enoyl-CoA hydratase n=1 Tax=Dickeya dadantii (strain 3937) TaxID=198628 RepID=E0SB44_DICD3|nr:enoyl-CoA hydratase-related protein [Dickeya dadantii]ADM97142.1 Enoyl-CoA hydratase [Dickeya dadantii 3937]NAT78949.1 enoyl-CoA hydratase [Dickeya dadantii]NPE50389.1 enoyl-CoA hydratase [Dickeya dadantii]NPE61011.1 enoyl-CoA hydratase [Dickeya dadantii]NPE64451.1 enoyl-CoA hydratase [Dickeya dadantii]